MDTFRISSEDCLILRAISHTASLREAAKVLSCDPSGLLRKVQRLATEKEQLISKANGKWHITKKGQVLLHWTEEAIRSQKEALDKEIKINISTTLWLSEELLIPNFDHLDLKKHQIEEIKFTTPQSSFENSLLKLESDIVIACHPPENPAIAHKRCIKEEWITIAPYRWKSKLPKETNELETFLRESPYIRHSKVNPNAFYPQLNIDKLNTKLVTDQLIGIRSSVKNGLGWSCVPKILVKSDLQNKNIIEINIKPATNNTLCVWWLRERKEIEKIAKSINSWVKTI